MSEIQSQLDFSTPLPAAAEESIREGMARADSNADVRWKRVMDGCVLAIAMRQEYFVADDVIGEMEKVPDPPDTHNLSAIGPRMKEVSRTLGYMEATPGFQRSKRKEKNGNLQRVWRSLKFRRTSSTP